MTESKLPLVVLIMGPTASGKTDLAIELVARLPADIISVDSAMIYRGMDIGTAKPDPATLRSAPHRLIDIADPSERYSAGRFRRDAIKEIEQIVAARRVPLLVGGTMLYFRALTEGLADMPAADRERRAEIDARAARLGWPALHAELAVVDPDAATRIHPNDAQRIQRALEVFDASGTPISAWHRSDDAPEFPYRVLKFALAPPREEWAERIRGRFDAMLAAGLVEEVATLYRRGDLDEDLPAVRAVGYRQIWAYLAGRTPLEEAIEKAVTATRQLAKRQMTWLRRESSLVWLDPADPENARNIGDLIRAEASK